MSFTEGDTRWIKRHTQKTFEQLSKKVDVLDDKGIDPKYREFWNKMFAKMNTLLVAMETSKGNYDIDDPEIRWVSDRIEYWNSEERIMSSEEMSVANHYWKKYKK